MKCNFRGAVICVTFGAALTFSGLMLLEAHLEKLDVDQQENFVSNSVRSAE